MCWEKPRETRPPLSLPQLWKPEPAGSGAHPAAHAQPRPGLRFWCRCCWVGDDGGAVLVKLSSSRAACAAVVLATALPRAGTLRNPRGAASVLRCPVEGVGPLCSGRLGVSCRRALLTSVTPADRRFLRMDTHTDLSIRLTMLTSGTRQQHGKFCGAQLGGQGTTSSVLTTLWL